MKNSPAWVRVTLLHIQLLAEEVVARPGNFPEDCLEVTAHFAYIIDR